MKEYKDIDFFRRPLYFMFGEDNDLVEGKVVYDRGMQLLAQLSGKGSHKACREE